MGRNSSIDEAMGKRVIEAYGRLKSVRKVATELGLSKDAVSRFLATVSQAAAPAVALPSLEPETRSVPVVERAKPMLEVAAGSLWDTKTVLESSYARIIKLADQLDSGIVEVNGEFSTMTPVKTHVAAIKEIREHIKTSMDMLRLLVDVDEVRKFQEAVLEAIGEVDESTKQNILAKLRERRALGPTLFRTGA